MTFPFDLASNRKTFIPHWSSVDILSFAFTSQAISSWTLLTINPDNPACKHILYLLPAFSTYQASEGNWGKVQTCNFLPGLHFFPLGIFCLWCSAHGLSLHGDILLWTKRDLKKSCRNEVGAWKGSEWASVANVMKSACSRGKTERQERQRENKSIWLQNAHQVS